MTSRVPDQNAEGLISTHAVVLHGNLIQVRQPCGPYAGHASTNTMPPLPTGKPGMPSQHDMHP